MPRTRVCTLTCTVPWPSWCLGVSAGACVVWVCAVDVGGVWWQHSGAECEVREMVHGVCVCDVGVCVSLILTIGVTLCVTIVCIVLICIAWLQCVPLHVYTRVTLCVYVFVCVTFCPQTSAE